MQYRHLSLATACVASCLTAVLLFAPGVIYWLFGVASDPSADFLARRAGLLFVGFAIISYLSRDIAAGPARAAISAGIGFMMAGLAALGVYEFMRGFAGPGIWLAIVTELAFAVGYAAIFRSDRSLSQIKNPQ